ncbi:Ger(x)C family spore germination protein [Ectobacillus funiculus]|uniref:Ger(x)C family spore germination protein n=1 Tax=Ectobacillus funiculus TaxID=137993 RepID=UPI00397D3D0C
MKKVRGLILLLILLYTGLLAGCWNQRELSQLSMVTAIGIDQAAKDKEYRVSLQVINPSAVAGGQGQGGGEQISPITVYTETGPTISTAIYKTSQKIPREPLFTHVQLIIIGESFAKRGIQDLFDLFERSPQARLTSSVLVTKGNDAKSIISTISPSEKIPANAIMGKVKVTEKLWSENIKITIDEVIKDLVSKENGLVISGITFIGNHKSKEGTSTKLSDILKIQGMALFKDGKLVRWLEGSDARGVMWIKNKMESTIYDLDCKEKKYGISVKNSTSKTNVTVTIKNEKPIFSIHIFTEGTINEVKCDIDLSDPEEVKKLETQWGDQIKNEIIAAIDVAQRENSDIYGFGKIINRTEPKKWKKIKKRWSETFAESQINVKVDAFIRQTGMRINPYLLQE